MNLSDWLVAFLASKSLERPDGRMLYGYDPSSMDFQTLEAVLAAALRVRDFASLVDRDAAFPPLFVLYGSEWWKREYDGGAWDWSPIVERLSGKHVDLPQQLRSTCVTQGLRFWGHRPLAEGKRFLGAIVAQGGIPMRLLALGAGRVTQVLTQVVKLADRYGWSRAQTLEAIEERQSMLPATYRSPEIADLFADFTATVLDLKSEYRLSEVADPIAFLDLKAPDWQRQFPISLESDAAKALLIGLVREVSTQAPSGDAGLFSCERRLVNSENPNVFQIESIINPVSRANGEDLARFFGINGAEHLPRYFSIDLESDARHSYLEGRVILGAAIPVVNLSGRRLTLRGASALAEHRLILRTIAGDLGDCPTILGGGEMPEDDPWIFVERDAGIIRHVSSGSVKLPDSLASIAIGDGWSIAPKDDLPCGSDVGWLDTGTSRRRILQVTGDVAMIHADVKYRVRLKQTSESNELYQWAGNRLTEAAGRPVFRGRNPPTLYRLSELGKLQRVPLGDQEWRMAGQQSAIAPRDARGPIDVAVRCEGETVARQRIVVLPPEAKIDYQSGSRVGVGAIGLFEWGDIDLAFAPLSGTSCTIRRDSEHQGIMVKLVAEGVPPAELKAFVRWRGMLRELTLTLPFPVTGGRFIRSAGSVMPDGERVLLRDLIGARLQIFDTNPSAPKAYSLLLSVGSGLRRLTEKHGLRVDDAGRADVRLIDLRKTIDSMLGMSESVEGTVDLALEVGSARTANIEVARYNATLERQAAAVALPAEQMANVSTEALERTEILAHPLVGTSESGPTKLMQSFSAGVPSGVWTTSDLDATLDPWLIFPSAESPLYFQPLLWTSAQADDAEMPTSRSDLCQLGAAILISAIDGRWRAMTKAIDLMASDYEHPSWTLVGQIWSAFHHLPLTALDLWRVLARQPKAVLAFLLRGALDDHAIGDAARRLRDEVGWNAELTSLGDWHEAIAALWTYHRTLIPPELAHIVKPADNMRLDLRRRLSALRNELPSLELTLALVEFELTNRPSSLLNDVFTRAEAADGALERRLWHGADSLGNTSLFLVNANRNNWPQRQFFEKAYRAFDECCPQSASRLIAPHASRLFWPKIDDFKVSVANMPMLCAIWAMTSASRRWWAASEHRLALRQIRDFDPAWFDLAYRESVAALLAIPGLIEPVCVVDFSN